MSPQDLIGKRFGRLVIVERAENAKSGAARWRGQCDCGGIAVSVAASLRRGASLSCGCLRKEKASQALSARRAAMNRVVVTNLPEYRVWAGMLHRCTNPEWRDYHRYGGRGISVDDRWAMSFGEFYRDMGQRPSVKHSLDRKDVNGPYTKSNCRWTTAIEQQNNKRNNRVIEYCGRRMTVSEAYRMAAPKVLISAVLGRLNRNWPVDEALR